MSVLKGSVLLGVLLVLLISEVVGPLPRRPGTYGTLSISSCVGTAPGIPTCPGDEVKGVRTTESKTAALVVHRVTFALLLRLVSLHSSASKPQCRSFL